jgi:hypothetical protein
MPSERMQTRIDLPFDQVEEASSHRDRATMLERDGDGDGANAMALLDESLAISNELGMRPLTERILALREILLA